MPDIDAYTKLNSLFLQFFYSSRRAIQKYWRRCQSFIEGARAKRIFQRCWTGYDPSFSGQRMLLLRIWSCYESYEQICPRFIDLWTFFLEKSCELHLYQHFSYHINIFLKKMGDFSKKKIKSKIIYNIIFQTYQGKSNNWK